MNSKKISLTFLMLVYFLTLTCVSAADNDSQNTADSSSILRDMIQIHKAYEMV